MGTHKYMCLKKRLVRTSMDVKVESCMQGHHVYSFIWISVLGEALIYEREYDNTEDW